MEESSTSSPGRAVSKAMASLRGKRTGVVFGQKGAIPASKDSGMEDPDQFWEAAKTPARTDESAKDASSTKKKKKALKPNNDDERRKRNVVPRFSFPGVASATGGGETGQATDEKEKVDHFLSRVQNKGGKGSWSPSEMSRVSTEPPTPAPEEEAPLSPEEVRAAVPEPEEPTVLQQARGHASPQFPVADADDADDSIPEDDDMLPPPPPEEEQDLASPAEDVQDVQEEVEFPNEVEDDEGVDDEDDKEGQGFTMAEDPIAEQPDTPESVREEEEEVKRQEKEKARKTKRKKKAAVMSDDDDETATPAPKKARKAKKKVTYTSPLGYPAGNREYAARPVSDYKESPEDSDVRRSRRAKFPPLAYWKNERPMYEAHHEEGILGEAMGCMPVVTGLVTAMPTPYKKRVGPTKKKNRGKSKGGKSSLEDSSSPVEIEQEPFDSSKLRKKYEIINGEEANIWDAANDTDANMKVVCYADEMVYADLPVPNTRKKSEGKVAGKATQSFNEPTDEDDMYVGYIAGNLILPPKGIKDPESSSACALTFTVCQAQPGACEVAFGDPHEPDGLLDAKTAQRFLLGPGDMFRVPPGNCYRLQNHSKTTDCVVTWTIIRPRSNPPPSPSSR